MEEITPKTKEQLKNLHRMVLNEYSRIFSEMMERQGEWMKDYSLWVTDEEAWTVEDMVYVVDEFYGKEDRYEWLRTECDKWLEYCVDCIEFNIQYINLQSWLRGAPRMSEKCRQRLRNAKAELERMAREYQEEYGELKNGVPEHLRNMERKERTE